MSLAEEKKRARLVAQKHRDQLVSKASVDAGARLAENVKELAEKQTGLSVVSGFLPIGSEIDVLPSLRALTNLGLETCLPVVLQKAQPLIFRAWREGDALESGPLQTRHPLPAAKEVRPDILLVPLLCFDLSGARLGWGGGFYDRTLAKLKRETPHTLAVGVAYHGQCVEHVPAGDYDVALDWVATEQHLIEINESTL